jgi:hypothetical protein
MLTPAVAKAIKIAFLVVPNTLVKPLRRLAVAFDFGVDGFHAVAAVEVFCPGGRGRPRTPSTTS